MKLLQLFILGLILTHSSAWASTLSVEWSCSSSSQNVTVNYNSSGKLQFQPDIFNGSLKFVSGNDYTKCIADFQRKINAANRKFREEQCPASESPFCTASIDYTDGQIVKKLQESSFVKSNPSVKPSAITSGAAAAVFGTGQTAQGYLESQIAEKKIDPKNLDQSFSFQGKSYKVADFDKVLADNLENIFLNMKRDEAKQFAQNYMASKSQYLNANKNPAKRKEVLDNLNTMFGYIYGDRGAEELAKILECEPEDNLTPIAQILDKVKESEKVQKCAALDPNEHKVFKQEYSDPYGTGDYLLKRKPDGNYQAVLNVKFEQANGSVNPSTMMNRVKSCMQEIAPYMKGPNNQMLELVVLTPEETHSLPSDQRPALNTVKIQQAGFQTNSMNYAQDINCATITHELLHLLGLCDEYEEDRPEYGDQWNCRVTTSALSIMRQTTATLNAVKGIGQGNYKMGNRWESYRKPDGSPVISSLLLPNHFHKILNGNCKPSPADGYNECASFAYKSSRNGPCNVPARCRDDSYFVGTPK